MKRPDTEAKMMVEKERRVAVGSDAPPTQMEEGRRAKGSGRGGGAPRAQTWRWVVGLIMVSTMLDATKLQVASTPKRSHKMQRTYKVSGQVFQVQLKPSAQVQHRVLVTQTQRSLKLRTSNATKIHLRAAPTTI